MTEKETLKALSIEWLEAWKTRDRQTLERAYCGGHDPFQRIFQKWIPGERPGHSNHDGLVYDSRLHCRFINIMVYKEFAVVNIILNISLLSGLAADDDAYQVTDV
jgi:hypothetical protein